MLTASLLECFSLYYLNTGKRIFVMKQDDHPIKDIIERYVDDRYTTKDIDVFAGLDHRQHIEPWEIEMDRCWEDSAHTSTVELEKYRAEAQTLLNNLKRKKRRSGLTSFCKYAAAIAVLLVSGFSLLLLFGKDKNHEEPVVYSEIYVARGERGSLTLPDGTHITLNSDTYLRYPSHFKENTRKIEVNGEIFLQVAPDSSKPFIVHTERVEVNVIGTSFNVKAYATDRLVMVSVRSGKVQVNMPEARMKLKSDEMIILDKDNGELEKRTIDSRRTTSWMTGGLYFNKTTIEIVAKELERYYNCTIAIEGEMLKKEVVCGEHSNENLDAVLKALEYAVGIKNRKEEEDRIILYRDSIPLS